MKTQTRLTKTLLIVLSLLFALTLALGIVVFAQAETTGTGTADDPFVVTTAEEFATALNNTPTGDDNVLYITLGGNVTLSGAYLATSQTVIDLATYTITAEGSSTYFGSPENSIPVTFKNGTIVAKDKVFLNAQHKNTYYILDKITVEGGTLACVNTYEGTLNATDCTFRSSTTVVENTTSLTLTNCEVTSSGTALSIPSGHTAKITGGSVMSTANIALQVLGSATVDGCALTATANIALQIKGSATVDGCTLTASANAVQVDGESVVCNISNSELISTGGDWAIWSNGNTTLNNCRLSATANGVFGASGSNNYLDGEPLSGNKTDLSYYNPIPNWVKTGGTLKLLADIEWTGGYKTAKIEGKPHVLDLNGKTITANGTAYVSSDANEPLVVKNGNIIAGTTAFFNADVAGVYFQLDNINVTNTVDSCVSTNGGTFEATNCSFTANSNIIRETNNITLTNCAVNVTGATAINVGSGVTAEISNCSITTDKFNAVCVDNATSCQINNSVLVTTGSDYGLWTNAPVTVNNSYISSSGASAYCPNNATITLDGVAVTENATSSTYNGGATLVQVGDTLYEDFNNAITALNANGGALKLLADCTVASGITLSTSMTFDLNGKTLSYTATSSAFITTNSNVTLTVKNGTIESASGLILARATSSTNTKLVLNNATLKGVSTSTSGKVLIRVHNLEIVDSLLTTTKTSTSGMIFMYGEGTISNSTLTASSGSGPLINVDDGASLTINDTTSLEGSNSSAIKASGNLVINGGTIKNHVILYDSSIATINGGTLTDNVQIKLNSFVAKLAVKTGVVDDTKIVCNDDFKDTTGVINSQVDGEYTNYFATSAISIIKDGNATYYKTFTSAINAATETDVIVLQDDLTLDAVQSITKSVTLDLNGKTITANSTAQSVFQVNSGADFVITDNSAQKDGKIVRTSGLVGIFVNGGTFTLNAGTIDNQENADRTNYGIYVYAGSATVNSGTVQANRAVYLPSGASLNVTGGTITGTKSGLEAIAILGGSATVSGGNVGGYIGVGVYDGGSLTVSNNANISGSECAILGNGAEGRGNTNITISGGTVTGIDNAHAIYHPQDGTLTVQGGNVTGATGIEMRSGSLIVTGGTITGTAEFSASPNGSGSTVSGVGIAVSQHATNNDISLSVSGDAVITGTKYALYETDLQDDTTTNVTMSVTGGKFIATAEDGKSVASENVTGFVSGGTFSHTPVEFVNSTQNYVCATYDESTGLYTPTTQHTFGDWIDEVSATCSKTGEMAHKDCTACGKHFDQSDEEIADLTIAINPDAHSYDYACDGDCNLCGATREVSHNYVETFNDEQHWRECECGKIDPENPKTNHTIVYVYADDTQHQVSCSANCSYGKQLSHDFTAGNDCVCGAHSHDGGTTVFAPVTQEAWNYVADITAGNYVLTENVTSSADVTIAVDVTICLNSFDITMGENTLTINGGAQVTVCECHTVERGIINGSGVGNTIVVVSGEGTLLDMCGNIYDGNKQATGVLVTNNATFNFRGGSISRCLRGVQVGELNATATFNMYDDTNEAIHYTKISSCGSNTVTQRGSGVLILGGTFNLYDGTITSCMVGNARGAGVAVGNSSEGFTYDCTFNMYGGAIAGNKSGDSCGSAVSVGGATTGGATKFHFNMSGGEIVNSGTNATTVTTDLSGVAVIVDKNGRMTMTGGKIHKNSNGGVYMEAGVLTLYGSAYIYENGSYYCNLMLGYNSSATVNAPNYITIGGKFTEGAKVGVAVTSDHTTEYVTHPTNHSNVPDDVLNYLVSDVTGKELILQNKVVSLHAHSYTIENKDETHHWQECSCGEIDASTKAEHTYKVTSKDQSSHILRCSDCSNSVTQAHSFVDGVCSVTGCAYTKIVAVQLMANGGAFADGYSSYQLNYTYGDTLTAPTEEQQPTRKGYVLTGWAIDDKIIQEWGFALTEDVTYLSAVWELEKPNFNVEGNTQGNVTFDYTGNNLTVTCTATHPLIDSATKIEYGLTKYDGGWKGAGIAISNQGVFNLVDVAHRGEYKVRVSMTIDGEITSNDFFVTVTINPLQLTSENVTVELGENPVYNGQAQNIAVNGISVRMGETTKALVANVDYQILSASATDVNSANYVLQFMGIGNYAGTVQKGNWNIAPKVVTNPTMEIETPTDGFVYNGNAYTPTVVVKDGDVVINSTEYSVAYSNNVSAGTATVTITDATGGNYTVSGSTTFEIAKADPIITWPTNITGIGGNSLASIVLEQGFAWSNADTVIVCGNNQYEISYTPADTENYNKLTSQISVNATHSYRLVAKVEPTCSATGMENHYFCDVCDTFFTTEKVSTTQTDLTIAIDATAHSFGEWTQTTAPTCTAKGVDTRVCSHNSAHTETRDVEKIAHTAQAISAVEPTCTQTGLTAGEKCSVCGEILTAQQTVDALGHDFVGGEYLHDETHHWKECSRCDAVDTENKVIHEYVDDVCVCGKEATNLAWAIWSLAGVGLAELALILVKLLKRR